MDPAGRANEWAAAFFAAQPVPALSLAVAGPEGPRWQAALGQSDLEFGIPARPDHLFRIGSVSKAITATLAARLVTRGVVDLDTSIAFWLPDLPRRHRATTLAQLLTHRGGVRHYTARDLDPAQPGGPLTTRGGWTRHRVLDAFIHDELVAEPGTTVSYTSFGYTLASLVLEAAAGAPFLDLVAEQVGEPFGLVSLAADRPLSVIARRARGYQGEQERQMLRQHFPDAEWPAAATGYTAIPAADPAYCWAGAGLLLSVPDTARFGAAHLPAAGAAVVSEAERALLFTPRTQASAASPPMGLGWRVDHDAQGRLRWHHAGATLGGRAVLVVYPELDLSIALASNVMTAPGDVLGPAADLADLFA